MNVTAQKVWFSHEVVNTGDRYIAISLVPGRKKINTLCVFLCHDWFILYPKNRSILRVPGQPFADTRFEVITEVASSQSSFL